MHDDRVALLIKNGSGVPSPCTAVVKQYLNGNFTDSKQVPVTFTYDGYFGAIADFSDSASGEYTYTVELVEGTPVTVPVADVALSPASVSLVAGDTQQLTATVVPNNATNKKVSYSSDNTAAVTVSASGLITAIAAGNATVTVTTADGNKTAVCTVTVTAVPACSHANAYTVAAVAASCTVAGTTQGVYCPDCNT